MFEELGWTTVSAVEETFGAPSPGLAAANREVYLLLKEGIKLSVPKTDLTPLPGRGGEGVRSGGQKTERLRMIDWEQPANNDFLLVSQFSVTGARRGKSRRMNEEVGTASDHPSTFILHPCPRLVVIKLKQPGVPARTAFDENMTHYKQQIPALFWFNALLIESNGTDIRIND